ncbi:MAG TPA: hypothetical protein PKN33_18180 [Phycisphaerae bacterium]|nr:hypothetical protein [Phycisphaerae bacterium]
MFREKVFTNRRLPLAAIALTLGACAVLCLPSCKKNQSNSTPSTAKPIAEIDASADPLSKFKRLLPDVVSGEVSDKATLDAFIGLAQKHAAVRTWIAEVFDESTYDEQFTLMAVLKTCAANEADPEWVPMIRSAIENNQHAISALRALRSYDIADRKELIMSRIEGGDSSDRFVVGAALEVYLELYGTVGIEELIETLLESPARQFRGDMAAIVVGNCEGELKQKALVVLNAVLSDPGFRAWGAVAGFFSDLVKAEECGDEQLVENAKRILAEGDTPAKDSVQKFLAMCAN